MLGPIQCLNGHHHQHLPFLFGNKNEKKDVIGISVKALISSPNSGIATLVLMALEQLFLKIQLPLQLTREIEKFKALED